jgi:1-acyl-sn-glycerol-3-phosphate acyltransferase
MKRIIMMILRLFWKVPIYFIGVCRRGNRKKASFEEAYAYLHRIIKDVNCAGRVTIQAYGVENIPKENGFVLFPNHQGLFDVLVFLDTCPVSFSFVIKKEVSNVLLLKQVIKALDAIAIDRKDLRQSMEVINMMSEQVRKGRNFLIFPEGTRSRQGNHLLDFKAGSFKSAVKAKCPIVPCALIDSFRPFDESSTRPVMVKVIYLPPIPYSEYADYKTVQIAAEVKRRIEETIAQYTEKTI